MLLENNLLNYHNTHDVMTTIYIENVLLTLILVLKKRYRACKYLNTLQTKQ